MGEKTRVSQKEKVKSFLCADELWSLAKGSQRDR
jgi:hypothetical protein